MISTRTFYIVFSDLTSFIWSVNHDVLTPVTSYTINQYHLKSNIAELLDQNVNLIGAPKLFLVSCSINCLQELLRQVGDWCLLVHGSWNLDNLWIQPNCKVCEIFCLCFSHVCVSNQTKSEHLTWNQFKTRQIISVSKNLECIEVSKEDNINNQWTTD